MEKFGTVYLIGAGPGAPDLITLRGLRAIQSSEVILYDRILGESFLQALELDLESKEVEWLGAGEIGPQRQKGINQKMLESAQAGKVVARVKNGDPFIFGRGAEEAAFLKEHQIPYEVIPGLSSATSVLTNAEISLTSRLKGRSFAVTSALCAGGEFNENYPQGDSLVILMGAAVLDQVAQHLIKIGWPEETPAILIERGTFPEEKKILSTLNKISEEAVRQGIRSPAVLAVGSVAES